ncbi:hypothetical protein REPUB_Repub04eG0011200 [Reevesia pubescens]
MKGYSSYSRIKVVSNEDSSSMDSSSDLMPQPDVTSKPTSNPTPNSTEKNPEIINQIIKKSNPNITQDSSDHQQELDDEEGNINNGDIISGPKLRRNSSVSSAYALQAAVKRAFSMRRSSSVSERYCRIHDQSVTLASPFDDVKELDIAVSTRRSVKNKKNSRGKILKAWNKLFGL